MNAAARLAELRAALLDVATSTGAAPRLIGEALAEIHRQTGVNSYARAARAIFQDSAAGRPAIDDRAALEEAQWLFESRRAPTLNCALLRVARAICGASSPRSVAERLRRKLKNSSTK